MLTRSITAAAGGFLLVSSLLFSIGATAQTIPYPAGGTPAPPNVFTATTAGPVTAYFAGSTASYESVLGLRINGVATGVTGLDNHSSAIGDSLVLGTAPVGASLTFFINVLTTGDTFYSNPTLNSDLVNHAYATPFFGGTIPGSASAFSFPAGTYTYVAFEDILHGGDLNYQDLAFVFGNTTATPVAAPGPVAGAGLIPLFGLAAAWYGRRRKQKLTA
jgi:hypothetical protein